MRVFAYEMVTAGGLPAGKPDPGGVTKVPPAALLAEGRAMIEALATDLAACRGVQVEILWDANLAPPNLAGVSVHPVCGPPEERAAFDDLSRKVDGTIVIAPETGGLLAERCRRVLAVGGRLLGPAIELVELASDKSLTATHLAAAGVRVPAGIDLPAGERLPPVFSYPAVLKPRDGAGSQNTFHIADAKSAARYETVTTPSRLERFCPGRAASVAMLCGRGQTLLLPACWQRLSGDGRFTYLGGGTMGDEHLQARAWRLAEQVAKALPAPQGYLCVDLVLGNDPSGEEDRAIEVNPRLTTSYVGLRHAVRSNLAQAWLDLLAGRVPSLPFESHPVEFSSDGRVACGSRRQATNVPTAAR
jgi:tyramine---L-glutamate ligase